MKCKFSQHGCRVELIKTKLENHEKNCKFVPVQCPILDCRTKIHISKVIHHLSTTKLHRVNHVKDWEKSFHYEIDWDTNRDQNRMVAWVPEHLELDGEHFYLEFARMPNGTWYSWVYIIGTKKLAENYIYTLRLTGENKVKYTSLVHKNICKTPTKSHFIFQFSDWEFIMPKESYFNLHST